MKGYGSADDAATTPPRVGGGGARSLATPQPGRPSMPRNESAGGATTHTNESEPLLGEQLLLGNDDEVEAAATPNPAIAIDSKWMSPADASTIGREGSDVDTASGSDNPRTPRRTGSPKKALQNSDPRIGINVNIGSTQSELDTLAYSRDPDESTLFTTDNFTRKYLPSVDEDGNPKGLLGKLLGTGHGSDRPYMLVCLGLAVGISLCAVALLAFVEYSHSHGKSVITDENVTMPSESTWHGVPYAKIGRESFGDPVSSIMDVSLFHPSLLYGGKASMKTAPGSVSNPLSQVSSESDDDDNAGNRRLANASPKPFLKVPFPTGAFWTNLVLLPRPQSTKQHAPSTTQASQTQQKGQPQMSYPIVAYPYAYQWSSLGKLQASYSAARRVVTETSIQDAFAPDITLGSVEAITTRHVVKFDSLSVTLRFSGSNSESSAGNGFWETYLVQGSPYITAKYAGLSPELTALSDFHDITCPPTVQVDPPSRRRLESAATTTVSKKLGICDVTEDSSKHMKAVTGVQFIVTTKEQLTWLVFASEPITFELMHGARHVIKSREQYGGVIRVALLPPSTPTTSTATTSSTAGGTSTNTTSDTAQLASSPGYKRLIYHAGAYPVGGTVSWDFRPGSRDPLASSTTPVVSSKKGHGRALRHEERQRRMASEAPKENNIGTVTFAFDTVHWTSSSPNTNVPLLMLCLPHHAASISSADKLLLRLTDFDYTYRSIKGRMVPVVGNTWSYEEELTFMGFGDETLPAKTNIAQSSSSSASTSATSQRPIIHESTAISTLDQTVRDLILATVESDLQLNLPVLSNGAYGFGKQIARMAQLAHIAEVVDAANVKEVEAMVDRIKNTTNNGPSSSASSGSSVTASGTARRGYALLEKYLTMWLVGDGNQKRLAYDAQLGGILSKEGMGDINADFGNARYNDHHFHYGYVLYAAAILGRANPKFISQYGPFVDALFYDVAHSSDGGKPNDDGIFFPMTRHKSWFDGHSFASGLFPFANGKSQESSSEAVNCYYGAYLWSRVRWGTDHKMVDFARLLLATEVTGAKTYWHMTPANSKGSATNSTIGTNRGGKSLIPVAYNSAFRENLMVGNLGMTDATCTTWFGNENIYVHLINFMPVTAITAELFDKGYVKGERSALTDGEVEKAWKGYLVCNEAIVDPNSAWIEAQDLISAQLDPGLSKSQVLFWASTREGFSPGTTAKVPKSETETGDEQSPESWSMPESSASVASTKNAKTATTSDSMSSCSSHEQCVSENLVGFCCPTSEGIFLRCCS